MSVAVTDHDSEEDRDEMSMENESEMWGEIVANDTLDTRNAIADALDLCTALSDFGTGECRNQMPCISHASPTPGADGDPTVNGWAILIEGEGQTLMEFDATEDDARLIASAPDLYAALVNVIASRTCNTRTGDALTP